MTDHERKGGKIWIGILQDDGTVTDMIEMATRQEFTFPTNDADKDRVIKLEPVTCTWVCEFKIIDWHTWFIWQRFHEWMLAVWARWN